MTRVVAVVPMRHSSERVIGKNYRDLAGKPLYHHIVDTLLHVPEVDEVVIDTDSPVIIDDAALHFPTVRVLLRPAHLRAGETPMNTVLLNTISQVDADVVLQTHSTNPFLSAAVLGEALRHFLSGGEEIDSVFGVTRIQARLWNKEGQPLNHDPAVLLRTQDLPPVYLENSCFYIFTPAVLVSGGNRIGPNKAMHEVPQAEALDIDEESDFELAIAVAEMRAKK